MKKIFPAFVVLLFVFNAAYAESIEGCQEHVKYGAPSLEPVLLCRLGYALSHDADHKVPDWVAYHLIRDKIMGFFAQTPEKSGRNIQFISKTF